MVESDRREEERGERERLEQERREEEEFKRRERAQRQDRTNEGTDETAPTTDWIKPDRPKN
jgi:hypothetical protein